MIVRKTISWLIVFLLASAPVFAHKEPSTNHEVDKLAKYLKSHWKSPENYVISKFADHDIVFIGEYHRIKHDVELIHKLIPRLYKAGIYNLGIEFGCYEHRHAFTQYHQIAYLPNPAFRKRIKKPDDLIAAMRRSADMKRRFKDLK
jgi:hypothetical protein